MAKRVNGEHFENAIIDMDDMTITEITGDAQREYDLFELLERWSDMPGIRLDLSCAYPVAEKAEDI